MEEKEAKKIVESSTIKQKLIHRLQELEKENLNSKVFDSEEAIVNEALMYLLYGFKKQKSKEEKGEFKALEGLFINLDECLIDFHEDLNKW